MTPKSKSDRIHELLPSLLNSRQDINWSAVIAAIGAEDDRLAQLIAKVRDQFFVKTASRPYLDRLAANSNISRPQFIGVSDADFRNYVPILSYQPKQVKHIVETLLDLFFFKESTTAFLSSTKYEPFALKDGWSLQLLVDNLNLEDIKFVAADFSDVTQISIDELVAAYNRQAKYSYATAFFDSVTKHNYIRVFTNTIGSDGSLEIVGGLANIGLQLNGFLLGLGTGTNTQWSVTKIGDTVTFTYTGGALPGIDQLEIGDIYLCDIPGNVGSFPLTAVDIQNGQFQFKSLFATTGSVTQTSADQSNFLRPEKICVYRSTRHALVWETKAGEVTVEMPATPSIVQRAVKGGFHLNGSSSLIDSVDSATSLTVVDASSFPASGQFVIQPANSIMARLSDSVDDVVTYTSLGRLISALVHYSYTDISDNTLQGVTPDLPTVAQLREVSLASMSKTGEVVTCRGTNDFLVGESVAVRDSSGVVVLVTTACTTATSPVLTSVGDLTNVAPGQLVHGGGIPANTKVLSVNRGTASVILTKAAEDNHVESEAVVFCENTNGTFEIVSADATSFTFRQLGLDGVIGTPGVASVERFGLAEQSAKVIVTSAQLASDTRLVGSYVWDPRAPFVLSSSATTSVNAIVAGRPIKLLDVSSDTIPDKEGFLIFDYGQKNQEGPVRYLYKPADSVLALDPSYMFLQPHRAGCSVVLLSHRGPHMDLGLGSEYPPYLTNPSDARLIVQDLIRSVTSAGIFIDFLVRYPVQLYGTLSVYD